MNIKDLQNKKIAILGLGLENLALVKYLLKHKIKCEITVCDARENIEEKIKGTGSRVKPGMTKIFWQLGKGYNKNLEKFDILFRAPGWSLDCPGIKMAKKKGVKISSPMQLFFKLSPTKNIIGVTGTKGKGTTSSLIYKILETSGKRVWLGGNIGVAPFEFIDKIKKNDWVVLELSSFQLEDMEVSPHISVITNFYSEHLAPADPNNPNYHKTLKDYRDAKINIAKWQSKKDYFILNSKLKNIKANSRKVYFKKSELTSKLIGEHNKENIAAAVEVAKIIGIKFETIKKAVANFKGLEHRLEFVREIKGIKYYDDSFATTPEAAIIALKSFNQPVVILLGGADKGSDFKQLAKEVKKRCKFVVLINGKATPRIKKQLLKFGYENNRMKLVNNIEDVIKIAKAKAAAGDVILLSTACASFGMFKNYKERGNLFKKQVKSLPR
ncbi:MAG: UDP-N-acetylmuramoyl-L-alanine--D-glutamate ligase [Patescibacteria group bacterium]|jgi:UDP-N-acetylmuramoylalanine--D-glutamate ligase